MKKIEITPLLFKYYKNENNIHEQREKVKPMNYKKIRLKKLE